jgi:alpha-mannosidase
LLHQVRWTPQKIAQRIKLIEPWVYRQRQPLPPFRYKTLSSPLEDPPIGEDVDDSAWYVDDGFYAAYQFSDTVAMG